MWPGPYGEWGSRKYLLSSLDQSLARMGLDYVDIFYSHRLRPGHAARGDDGRARRRGAPGQGAVRGHLVLLGRAHARGRRDPARARHAAAHPPAVVLACSTAGSSPSCSTCSARRASARSSSRRSARGCSRRSTSTACRRTRAPREGRYLTTRLPHGREPRAGPRAERDRAAARAGARADGDRLGAARPARDVGADRRVAASSSSSRTSPRSATSTSPTTSSPRSTATRSTPASTSGRSRATPDVRPSDRSPEPAPLQRASASP